MLLAQVQQMDSQGWDRLVQIFGPIIYRWCRTAGIDNSDAPDIVQEVFASLVRGIPDFRRLKETGSFRCWLATITPDAFGITSANKLWSKQPEEPQG
ncbi:MAG: sigma factor [Pirellulaceae bacterium]